MVVDETITAFKETVIESPVRAYVPEQYPITVSLFDKLNVRLIIGNMNGTHIKLDTNHQSDHIVWWVSVGATGHHNIGRSIRQQHLHIADLAPNFATVLQLLEDGHLHTALTALTQH